MLLDDIKILLGIKDTSKDDVLNIYIRRAVYIIKNYINSDRYSDDDIVLLFSEAVISLVVDAQRIDMSGNKGIKSQSQGARSITYADEKSFVITEDIKAILPVPFVKMR